MNEWNEKNETKRNETKRNETKQTKMGVEHRRKS